MTCDWNQEPLTCLSSETLRLVVSSSLTPAVRRQLKRAESKGSFNDAGHNFLSCYCRGLVAQWMKAVGPPPKLAQIVQAPAATPPNGQRAREGVIGAHAQPVAAVGKAPVAVDRSSTAVDKSSMAVNQAGHNASAMPAVSEYVGKTSSVNRQKSAWETDLPMCIYKHRCIAL